MSNFTKIDLEEVKTRLKNEVSIEEVHERYTGFIDRVGSSSTCPFCGKKGKFYLGKKTIGCFSGKCSAPESMDIFEYYKFKYNVGFFEAHVCLGRDFGYIPEDVAEKMLSSYTKKPYTVDSSRKVDIKPPTKEVKVCVPLQSPEIVSNVYNAISRISPLKDYQYKYLRNARDLSINRILADYFDMPYTKGECGYEFMNNLLGYIKDKFGYDEDVLIGVPGFYKDENDRIVFKGGKGIAMKSRNASRMVNGIQIRGYDYITKEGKLFLKNEEYKYLWLTSKDLKDGCSSKSIIDVVVPEGEMYTSVVITEGKFKAELVSREYKSPVIALPGVNRWVNVLEPEISYINDNIRNVKNILVAFDGDMSVNLSVYHQFNSMYNNVLESYPADVYALIWDMNFGKGIDDVILSGNSSKIKRVDCKKYCELYDDYIEEIKSLYRIVKFKVCYKDSENEVDKNELISIYNRMVLSPLEIEFKI